MPTIDHTFITETLQQLVRINSVNPSLSTAGPGEAEIAAYVEPLMAAISLRARVHTAAPGRLSVVGRRVGRGGGRSLMLNAHYDTVGVEEMPEPFSAEIHDDCLWGRGAYDMKGSLAACLGAAKALADAGIELAGDLLIAAVADEEHASLGTIDLLPRYPVDGAIVTEPSALGLCRAHKGFVWLQIEIAGRAAHGSQWQLGLDANLKMGRVLVGLEELSAEISRQQHPLLGGASLHVGLLEGGTAPSVYAANSRLTVERRTLPGETEALAMREVEGLLARLRDEDSELVATVRPLLTREPFEVAADSPIVLATAAAGQRVRGEPLAHVGEGPWMDSALLAAAGVDTVVLGPAGGGAHSRREWVELESVFTLAEILAETAIEYCGTSSR